MKGKISLISLMLLMIVFLAFYVSGQTPAATQQQLQREKQPPREDPLETRVFKLESKVQDLERRISAIEYKMRP
jgi:uncharacterized protein YceH (UPF0502 family)